METFNFLSVLQCSFFNPHFSSWFFLFCELFVNNHCGVGDFGIVLDADRNRTAYYRHAGIIIYRKFALFPFVSFCFCFFWFFRRAISNFFIEPAKKSNLTIFSSIAGFVWFSGEKKKEKKAARSASVVIEESFWGKWILHRTLRLTTTWHAGRLTPLFTCTIILYLYILFISQSPGTQFRASVWRRKIRPASAEPRE